MLYRAVAALQPPSEANLDTPEMDEAAVAAQRNEQDILMLAELAEIAMRLARAQEAYAVERLAAASADGSALNPGEDPLAAFNKIAQTVRHTLALKTRLAEDVKTRRVSLLGERAARRARQAEDHETAVKNAIETALGEVFYADAPIPDDDPDADPGAPDPLEVERREMFDDVETLLEDPEEFGDWLNRPIGETVAKLCVALGFDADMCVKRGDTWFVRRAATSYEIIIQEKRGQSKAILAHQHSP